ncbi:MAG: maleylpyruvate isomerase N-terminal domain-containing protein [Acidimicrobiales bacterium]
MDDEEILHALRAHRLALCDQLDGLTDEQWNASSLCAGWRVRDVLGHLVSLQALPTWKFMVGVYGMKRFDRRAGEIDQRSGRTSPERWSTTIGRWPGRNAASPSWGRRPPSPTC